MHIGNQQIKFPSQLNFPNLIGIQFLQVTSPRSSSRGPSPQQRSQTDISNVAGSEAGNSEVSRATQNQGETPQDWHWLVLDGPVDTLWVENLNTTLDDSKLLCLANGERITLTTGMRLLFEVDNLSQASPATISRCAMVYLVYRNHFFITFKNFIMIVF